MGILSEALAGGGKSLKPEHIGESVGGTITKVELTNYTNFESGEIETWQNGDPKQQMNISLTEDQTKEERCIYIKLWGTSKKNLAAAVEATGLDADYALAPGSHISMRFDREEPHVKNPRLNPTKIYSFQITPKANIGDALGTQSNTGTGGAAHDPWAQPAPQATQTAPNTPTPQPQTTTQAAPQAAPQAANGQPGGQANINQLIAAGLPDSQIAQILGLDPTVVATIRANS